MIHAEGCSLYHSHVHMYAYADGFQISVNGWKHAETGEEAAIQAPQGSEPQRRPSSIMTIATQRSFDDRRRIYAADRTRAKALTYRGKDEISPGSRRAGIPLVGAPVSQNLITSSRWASSRLHALSAMLLVLTGTRAS